MRGREGASDVLQLVELLAAKWAEAMITSIKASFRALRMEDVRAGKDAPVTEPRAGRGAELLEADSALERRRRRRLFRQQD